MFKLVKMLFTICLIGGISILGYEIYKDNHNIQTGLEDKVPEIRHKISEVKKEAEEKLAVAREIMEKASDAHKKNRSGKNDLPEEPLAKEKGFEPVQNSDVPLDPLDREDKDLTQKVLGKNIEDKKFPKEPVQITNQILKDSNLSISEVLPRQKEPLDLERVTAISELYSNANEVLNWE